MVVKLLNTDLLGRPTKVFKEIDSLYKSEDSTCYTYLDSKVWEVGDSEENSSGFGCKRKVKVEVPSMERRFSKRVRRNFQVNDADSSDDSDYFKFNELTLKELRSLCKLKKQKVQKSADSQQSDVKSFSQHDSVTVKIEEEPEMEETLSCLKLKLSNSKPKRRNKLHKNPHPFSEAFDSDKVLAEQETAGELCVLNRIKSEIVDMDSYVTENIAVADNCSATTCSLEFNLSGASCNDLHKVVDGTGTEHSSFIEEVKFEVGERNESGNTGSSASLVECLQQCSLNEESKDYMESEQPEIVCGEAEQFCQGAVTSSSETILADFSLLRSELSVDDEATCSLSGGSHCTVSDENLAAVHVSNSVSSHACDFGDEGLMRLETQKNVQPTTESDHGDQSIGGFNRLHITSHNFPQCLSSNTVPDFLVEEDVGSLLLSSSIAAVFTEAADAKDAVSDQNCTIEPESNSGNGGVESLTNDTLPVVESQTNNDKESTSFDHDNNSIKNIIGLQSTAQTFTSGFTSSGNSHFSNNGSCFLMENVVGAKKTSSSATRDTVAESPNGFDGLELGISPTRLLSTRQAISPLSQEKLLQAVDAEELQPNMQYFKGTKKLLFENWTKNESLSARPDLEDSSGIDCCRGRSKKSRLNCKSGSPPSVIKGILKTQSSDCLSSQKNARQAVLFSRMQMRHFESVAANLLKCLKSMKDIVEETLHSEAFPSSPSKYTADMKREAADNAVELEATTKRWLSMMSRDCNRFCKLMSLSEEKAASPNTAPKEKKKKISFADEVGFSLCHVKTFTKNPQLVSEN
ncbi:uncharacterized protein [Aristolochia californica]|uniref:uncharacterized protein n=1 Tax=Aristolochia californica TaxID=171875 RepID=UPI0035E2B2FA